MARTLDQFIQGASNDDVPYIAKDDPILSMILRTDSYKFGHPFAQNPNVIGQSAYGTARVSPQQTIVAGDMHDFCEKYLVKQRITNDDVLRAKAFAQKHFGRPLFAEEAWNKVVNTYHGHVPLTIRSLPGGFKARGQDPMYTVTCTDPDLHWMASGMETPTLRAAWYPSTIATNDYDAKLKIKHFYELAGCSLDMLPFALHDFGGRGVTCGEQAEIGGSRHTFNFMGSDTVEGVVHANHYFNEEMSAFSVFASEHSIQMQYGNTGPQSDKDYLMACLANARPGTICSIVCDGYDMWRLLDVFCSPEMVEYVKSLNALKVVLRPDSGDPLEIIPKVMTKLASAYGYTENAKHYRTLKGVGVLWGDGIDTMAIQTILGNMMVAGWAPDNFVFGSGGALLQKVNRDTYKWAQKICALWVVRGTSFFDGEHHYADDQEVWIGASKDPVTDPGKKSRTGLLTLARNLDNGELKVWDFLTDGTMPNNYEDQHELVYKNGIVYNEPRLSAIRERLAA
jgi:nicotinamide phosphoribosyltransferase